MSKHEVMSLCRAGRWTRLARGSYLADLRAPLERAEIAAALASFGPHAFAVLGTAAGLHGLAGLRATNKIHLSLPASLARAHRQRDDHIVVHQLVVRDSDITVVDGLLTTTPLRTVADTILGASRMEAISLLDSAVHQKLITEEDLAHVPGLIRRRRGAVNARQHVKLVDGRCESPLETRVRLRCIDAGVPPDEVQYPVYGQDGELLGIGDLAWVRARLIAEADGQQVHSAPGAIFADRARQNRLVNEGWRILRFTWADTVRPDYIPGVVRRALSS